MKKTVKSLIIAASVAAIAGIGAVSFAAWSGSTTTSLETSDPVSTGTMVAVGFVDADTKFTNTKKDLMPIDQLEAEMGGGARYWQADLKITGTDFTGYKITVKATAETDSAIPTGLKWHLKGDSDSAPTATTDISGWTALDNTPADVVASGIANGDTYTVYIALDSDNTNYDNNAGKEFKITFELTK